MRRHRPRAFSESITNTPVAKEITIAILETRIKTLEADNARLRQALVDAREALKNGKTWQEQYTAFNAAGKVLRENTDHA